jgi:hypothetical protein
LFFENLQVDFLSNRLGLFSDFGPSTLNNTWGCALLSAYPIVHVERWMLSSPEGELSCVLDARLHLGADKYVQVNTANRELEKTMINR